MIVKNLSRQSNTFRQIVSYLNKRISNVDVPWIVGHNLNCNILNSEEVIQAFKVNDVWRKKRKNGVAMYHDILSIPNDIREDCLNNSWKFEQIVREYIALRSPNGIAYAIPHFYQNNNPHVHVLFSANEFESSKSVRISKSQLEKIKKEMNKLEKELYCYKHKELSK